MPLLFYCFCCSMLLQATTSEQSSSICMHVRTCKQLYMRISSPACASFSRHLQCLECNYTGRRSRLEHNGHCSSRFALQLQLQLSMMWLLQLLYILQVLLFASSTALRTGPRCVLPSANSTATIYSCGSKFELCVCRQHAFQIRPSTVLPVRAERTPCHSPPAARARVD